MHRKESKSNLFIYGSLRDRRIFHSVSGLSFTRRPSRVGKDTLFADLVLLAYYRRVSPDNVYYYAVPDASSKIEGLLIRDVPASAMREIDRYEGKRYQRQTVTVNTADGAVTAEAYLASRESMKKQFGDRFHVNLIHELWLRKRIELFIKRHTRPGERTADAQVERQADRELLATTERDLVMSHYRANPVSDYYLEHELARPRPSIKHLYEDPQAVPFIENYLQLVVRQVLVNELDERIQTRYRFELERMLTSDRYFKRSVSLLAALYIINANSPTVDLIVSKCFETLPYSRHDLIDYVKYAVRAARSLFDRRVVEANLSRVQANLRPGLVPLGAEIELSNVGPRAVGAGSESAEVSDAIYDNFRYFHDFNLEVLSWKLGGYIDDHKGSIELSRRTGFLELAPGRLNIAGELSRSATADPWLLNQLIHEIVMFYKVRPHSLHLSFQLRHNQIGRQKVLPLGFVKCLLALGGGPEEKSTGRLWVTRIGYDEITQRQHGTEELVFAKTNKRSWYMAAGDIADKRPSQATTYVQQYKFIRLCERADYEPLIMCLKGLQLGYNPGDYLTAEQLQSDRRLRRDFEHLKKWAAEPAEIAGSTISEFIKTVQHGLMNERHHQPAHKLHYIDWAISAILVQLRMFNKQVKKSRTCSQG
ncbi:MAG TPA: gamma-glutamylcyclotransferase family protein [Sedimentisphaerales bacterium]|nr:gamma-glutamylcyclotransferase family protein [Sedimentisphaerales bacterium]